MSITNEKLTTGQVDGNGTFDLLMSTMNKHLQVQFEKGHLTGPQYSEVYLGGLSAAMTQSIEFLLRQETTNKQNELLDEQIEQAKKQTEQLVVQTAQIEAQTLNIEAQTQNTNKQTELLTAQIVTEQLRQDVLAKEILQIDKNLELIDAQIVQSTAQTAQIEKNIEMITRQIVQMDVQDAQTVAQTALIGAQQIQIENEYLQQAKNLELADMQLERGNKEIELAVKQIIGQENANLKLLSEIALLDQKTITEEGQTNNVSEGVIGKQIALYGAQIQGFADDATHKERQSQANVFSVLRSTNNAELPPRWYVSRNPIYDNE